MDHLFSTEMLLYGLRKCSECDKIFREDAGGIACSSLKMHVAKAHVNKRGTKRKLSETGFDSDAEDEHAVPGSNEGSPTGRSFNLTEAPVIPEPVCM